MISTGLMLGLTLVAAITDLWRQRIPNWLTYPGILAAFAVSAFEPGGIGLSESIVGFLGCGLVMLFCFVLFRLGGGDVKLLAMLGAFAGLAKGMEILLWTFVLGSIAALAMLIWRFGFLKLLGRGLRRLAWLLRLGDWLPLTDEERRQLQPELSLAPAAFLAVVIVKFSLFGDSSMG